MAQEVKIDLNARDNLKRSGFIWACFYNHSEVINLIRLKQSPSKLTSTTK